MSHRKNESLPKNRVLRRTLYRLLLAAPVLPLMACPGSSEDCVSGPDTLTAEGIQRNPDGSLSCANCPEHPHGARLTTCGESTSDGGVKVVCTYFTCNNDGRRPEGLQEPLLGEADSLLGALHAHVAWLEAASVPAFLRLADELSAHGAPEVLVKAARRSAADEVRHTRAMQSLARRHGARMPEVDIHPFQPRSLEAMLTENAIEGCVRETFGALVTAWQARTAGDAEVRRALGPISRDELRHAELAWAIDAWASECLTPSKRDRVLQARREALRTLEHEVRSQIPPEQLVREAGLPSREQALSLLHGMAVLVA
ncbi:ferritin-like domain-containing protein [Archangium violaceum]|uniref:ferritin-like domain-containing protein n=1 Tax=Archangium violaceum TaxID=83451 RepID=UPI00194F3A22|nr:ferritin-like domain-containing protein [Archangium violaceum]QRO01416.1 ferritin-like domain-containing protein [Archangium violaceum]